MIHPTKIQMGDITWYHHGKSHALSTPSFLKTSKKPKNDYMKSYQQWYHPKNDWVMVSSYDSHLRLLPRNSPPQHSCHGGHRVGKLPADPAVDSSSSAPSNAYSYWPSTTAARRPQAPTCHWEGDDSNLSVDILANWGVSVRVTYIYSMYK